MTSEAVGAVRAVCELMQEAVAYTDISKPSTSPARVGLNASHLSPGKRSI